jgi:hypothetical protein
MDLNIVSFLYLFLRLAPFILVCFFSMASIFNQDFKGLVYLVGLLLACFSTTMIGNAMFSPMTGPAPAICNMITINQSAGLSILPLGQTVFGYTFAYLLYSILAPSPSLVLQNIPTLVFFPVFILFDMYWNLNNSCNSLPNLLTAVVIGGLIGWLWGYIIGKSNSNLQYFSGLNNAEVCSTPSKQTFRCNVYKNGQMISKNIGGS